MSRPFRVIVDPDAFLHNLTITKKLARNSTVLAMVKSNAYGHGIEALLPALHHVEILGVSCLEEAIELRELGCTQPIILVEGFFRTDDLELITTLNLQVVLHQPYQLQMLEQVKLTKPLVVWLKVNIGMNRLGFPVEAIDMIQTQLKKNLNVEKPINLITHFSDADNLTSNKTQKQIELFQQISMKFTGLKSLANSAALLSLNAFHLDMVRPGIMLYGVSPFPGKIGADFNLKPVMTVCSELIAVNQIKKGDAIGYGSTWVCPENMPVGVVAIGYGDGYPRHAKNGTQVLVNGIMTGLVGRVSMDMISVDLRPCSKARVGDEVVLWGQGLPIEKVAASADTIAYELLCHINTKSVRLH